jgi:uncharacterized protein (TIGR00725 family)
MSRKRQISVIGFDDQLCTNVARETAYQIGKEIAKAGAVLITGGLGGVMEAACKGAKEAGGIVIGIVPTDNISNANNYCDAVIATGVGFIRNFFVIYSGDAIIIVGGGAGTLIEAAAAYQKKKLLIAVSGTGGIADKLADQYIDERKIVKVIVASGAREAVKKSLK